MKKVTLPGTDFPLFEIGKTYNIKDIKFNDQCNFVGEFKGFEKDPEAEGVFLAVFQKGLREHAIDTDFLKNDYYEIFEC